jgi:hypothetical protein
VNFASLALAFYLLHTIPQMRVDEDARRRFLLALSE